VLAYTASGTALVVTSGISCTSSDTGIVHADTSCATAYLDGSEAQGGAAAVIVSASGSLTGSFYMLVMTPVLPIVLSVTDAVLSPVHGWYTASDSVCTQPRIQQAHMTATTAFFLPDGSTTGSVDVTTHVAARLVSSNTTVVRVGADLSRMSVSHGQATLSVSSQAGILGQVQIAVDTTLPVYVLALDVLLLRSLQLSLSAASATRLDTVSYTVSATQGPLTFEGDRRTVVVTAVYTDLTRQLVTAADGLVLTSLLPTILQVDSTASFITVSSGAQK
jgi:hypothetical protein